VDVLRQIIGRKNIAELRTNLLNERFEMAAFGGKTLLIGSDVPGNFLQRSGAEVLKKLTGHDFIEAEFKGGNARTSLTGVFNILITSNNRLRVRLDGDEEAWRRRLLLVKFDNPPVEKKIADFAGILVRDEGKGILNWLINGAKKALADIADGKSIKLPEKLQNDADRLLFESNSVNNFIEECVTVAPGKDVSTFELQNAYVVYCNSNNLMAQPAKSAAMTFAKVMREKFNAINVNNIWRDFHKVHGYRDVALVGIS
jgi:phage/plasmid-associated DNA primase